LFQKARDGAWLVVDRRKRRVIIAPPTNRPPTTKNVIAAASGSELSSLVASVEALAALPCPDGDISALATTSGGAVASGDCPKANEGIRIRAKRARVTTTSMVRKTQTKI